MNKDIKKIVTALKTDDYTKIIIKFNGTYELAKGDLSKKDINTVIEWLKSSNKETFYNGVYKINLKNKIFIFEYITNKKNITLKGCVLNKSRELRAALISIKQDYLYELQGIANVGQTVTI